MVSPCHSTTLPVYPDGAYFNSIPFDIVFLIADLLNLLDLFSLFRTCRALHIYFLQGYFSSMIKNKINSFRLLYTVESCHTGLEDKSECVEMLLRDGTDSNVQDQGGSHVLQITAQYPSDSIVSQLLNSGCNPNTRSVLPHSTTPCHHHT